MRLLALLLLVVPAQASPLIQPVEAPVIEVPVFTPDLQPPGCSWSGTADGLWAISPECASWFIRRTEAADVAEAGWVAQANELQTVVDALAGEGTNRAVALKEARASKARTVIGTNVATNLGSLAVGGLAGFGICSARP